MNKQYMFSFTGIIVFTLFSFVSLNFTGSETVSPNVDLNSGATTMKDFLNVDMVLDVQTTETEEGTYLVKVTSLQDGQKVEQELVAAGYSPDGNCSCYCGAPQSYNNRQKVVIGRKCFCFFCIDNPIDTLR